MRKKKPKARRRGKSDQRGDITVPDLLLAKMISDDNRNQVQRDAMIDTMNKSQVQQMGKLVNLFLNSCTKLPAKTIKLLSKNQQFVKAITENKSQSQRKREFFNKKEVYYLCCYLLQLKLQLY